MLSLLDSNLSERLLTYSPIFVWLLISAALVLLPRLLLSKVDEATIPQKLKLYAERANLFFFQPMPYKRQSAAMIALIVGTVGAYAVRLTLRQIPVFPLDDAYITLHNAQVLRSGHDPNYLGIPALVGATSGVHLVLTACALPFFSRSEWALDAVAWAGALVFATGLLRLAFAYRASLVQSILLVVAGITAGKTAFHLFNGLETGLAMGALSWALALSVRGGERASLGETEAGNGNSIKPTISKLANWVTVFQNHALPVLLGMLPFIRPEFALLSLMLIANRGFSMWQGKVSAREWRLAFGKEIACMMLSAAPWLAMSFINTGSFFPQTIAAKRAFFAETRSLHFALIQFSPFLFRVMQLQLGAPIFGVFLLPFSKIGRLALGFMSLFLLVYLALLPGALLWNEQRYLYLLTPLSLLGILSMLGQKKEFLRSVGNILLLAAFFQCLIAFPSNWAQYRAYCDANRLQLLGTREWCLQNLPAGSKIAVHDAGAISWETPFVLTDLVGLKSPKSVEFHKKYTSPSHGKERAKAIDGILAESRSDYLILIEGWDKLYHFSDDLKDEGWRLDPLRPKKSTYQVYRITPPGE